MAYDFKPFEQEIAEMVERFRKELSSIRTGRATPSVLDGISVESYGSRVPISNVATISIEDARSLRIAPWDASQSKEIEKAIQVSNLGLSVGIDDRGVRVFFPELTGERRNELIKLAKERMEDARTSLRAARDRVWNDIQDQEKEKLLTEDEKFRAKDDMQKRVDGANAQFEEVFAKKEKEITN